MVLDLCSLYCHSLKPNHCLGSRHGTSCSNLGCSGNHRSQVPEVVTMPSAVRVPRRAACTGSPCCAGKPFQEAATCQRSERVNAHSVHSPHSYCCSYTSGYAAVSFWKLEGFFFPPSVLSRTGIETLQ